MTTDMTAPATKLDIKNLIDQMQDWQNNSDRKWHEWEKNFDRKYDQWKKDWDQTTAQWMGNSEETLQRGVKEMNLIAATALEQVQAEVKMINVEKIKDHDDRIIHLEVITGVRGS